MRPICFRNLDTIPIVNLAQAGAPWNKDPRALCILPIMFPRLWSLLSVCRFSSLSPALSTVKPCWCPCLNFVSLLAHGSATLHDHCIIYSDLVVVTYILKRYIQYFLAAGQRCRSILLPSEEARPSTLWTICRVNVHFWTRTDTVANTRQHWRHNSVAPPQMS